MSILKHLIVILFCFITAGISLICCHIQTETMVTSPPLLEKEIEFDNLMTGKISDSYYTAGTIKNNSDKLYDLHVDFLYYGPGNRLLSVNQILVQNLYPGMEKAIFTLGADDWSRSSKIEARVVNIVRAEESSINPDFTFENLSVNHHEHGTDVLGEVTSNDDMQYSIILLAVIYDKHGNLVMANIHGVDNLYPGETRIFSAPQIDKTTANDCQVYLSDIVSVSPALKKANIVFLNKAIKYNSDNNQSSLVFDIVNNDTYRYQTIDLIFGFYDQGKLIKTKWTFISNIGPGETVNFDQHFLDGDWTDKEIRININDVEID